MVEDFFSKTEPLRSADFARPRAPRLESVDLLRGLVMVIMALDHVRDYCSAARIDPTNLEVTTPALFLTRWITHYCAPVFVFLAGTGGFLAGTRGKTTTQLSWFLLTRGLWLVVLEVTLVHWSWNFNFDWQARGGAVIWAIGWSMVGLSGLVFLPLSSIVVFGLSVIAFHNLFDGVRAEHVGHFGWLWAVAHSGETLEPITGFHFSPAYPVLPWLGVMAAGYGFGALMQLDPQRRRRELFGLGLALVVAFIVLRWTNRYGDQRPWTPQPDALFTLFSFLNCWKYPPSLMYLLMTLGPAIVFLALADRPLSPLLRPLVVFGRVPLFYYLLHLPLIHAVAIVLDQWRFGYSPLAHQSFWALKDDDLPSGYGWSLPMVYVIWISIVLLLYLPCRWFARLKQRYPAGWLSYL